MTLRPYQLRGLEQVRAQARGGSRAICVVLPTGGGKTLLAAELAKAASDKGNRVLWLTHTQELVDQSRARVPWATVRSIQSLLGGERPEADVVILDECHHFCAPQWGSVARDYTGAMLVGLTATPERADGVGLGDLFTSMVVVASTAELVRDGYLVPARVWYPGKVLRGIADPIATWQERAPSMRTVVYAGSVEAARKLAADWPVPATSVDGSIAADVRRERIAAFVEGRVQVLTNCFVLTEGWDVPAVECVVLARGFSSCGAYLQAVGRALRPSPGKTEALVLDLHGSAFEHGLPDQERTFSLTGKPISGKDKAEVVRECRVCGFLLQVPGPTCPRCGAEVAIVLSRAQRIERNALMRELKAQDIARRKEQWSEIKAGWRAERRKPTFGDLLQAAQAMGYSAGWAANMFKVYWGSWPRRERAA